MLSYFFGGTKEETKKQENEDPEKAMEEALDEHGEFLMDADGTF